MATETMRAALVAARAVILQDRDALIDCHTGPDGIDADGREAAEEYDCVLRQIDAALAEHPATDSNGRAAGCDRLRAERDHARALYDRAIERIVQIHGLLYPRPVNTADGRALVFRPDDLDPHEAMQRLSDRIRALSEVMPAQPAPRIGIGDAVHHAPTGEDWVVARVDGEHLYPSGWPCERAKLADCTLIHKATDKQRADVIEGLRRLPASDPRHIAAEPAVRADKADARESAEAATGIPFNATVLWDDSIEVVSGVMADPAPAVKP